MTNTPSQIAALGEAVEEDHPCTEQHCDIRFALATGHTEVAAYLLVGATEASTVEGVARRYDINLSVNRIAPKFAAWVETHRQFGVKCGGCDAFNYPEDDDNPEPPRMCSNCGCDLPAED